MSLNVVNFHGVCHLLLHIVIYINLWLQTAGDSDEVWCFAFAWTIHLHSGVELHTLN